ncbi:uncharacterized protein LTR77_009477 [Saxophila tyrrhenica]|uniref:F-box domain-containing protein n=1 Tax=Saxophila tyrrhenica TaxID=1690608 RepID=A0AAV9NYP2_9PEZI|nr:hypothetical protein LTR77_009477 [Saxophila tyrrhenica]
MDAQQPTRSLETLPAELRRCLLSNLHLAQLSALVHASPVYHQQYLVDRKYLLSRSIEQTLGSVAADALFVHELETKPKVERVDAELLKRYSENASRRRLPYGNDHSQAENVDIAAFHLRYVEPLATHYAHSLLENLAGEANSDKGKHVPTASEMVRLTRAMYRFQLLCQLAGPAGRTYPNDPREDSYTALINLMEPWEVEELLSFYQFARGSYEKILNDVRWDFHEDNPRFAEKFDPQPRKGPLI